MKSDPTEVRPLAFGYFRLHTQEGDDELGELEAGMRERAERDGYRFVTTFHEYDGSLNALQELINLLRRVDARRVIVPTVEHLSCHRLFRLLLLERLEEAPAEVFTSAGELLSWCDGENGQLDQ